MCMSVNGKLGKGQKLWHPNCTFQMNVFSISIFWFQGSFMDQRKDLGSKGNLLLCCVTTALYSSADHLQPRIQLPNSPGKLFFEIGVFLMNIAVKLINLRLIGACLTDLDSDWRWHLSIIARPRPRLLTANIKRTRPPPGPTAVRLPD